MATQATYVNYPGSIILTLPVEEKYTQIYGFLLDGDKDKLQALVDMRLNFMTDRPDVKYIVASEKVLFSFTSSVVGRSLGSDIKMGYGSEDALLTFIVLARCTKDGDGWSAQELVLFAPFTFVDNPMSMAVGREMYGFPKTIGVFDMPTDYRFVNNFTFSAIAFSKFNVQAHSYMQPLVTINKILDDANDTEINDAAALWKQIQDQALPTQGNSYGTGLMFYLKELGSLMKGEVPLVFLRQLRDIANPDLAAYQALIAATGKVTAIRGVSLYSSKYEVTINETDTYPLVDQLGIAPVSIASLAFRVELDLQFGLGTEEYRSA